MSLIINDFSSFAHLSEDEFVAFFEKKCDRNTALRYIYRQHSQKKQDVPKDKESPRRRKKARPK